MVRSLADRTFQLRRAALRSARHAGKNPLRAGGWWLWLPLRVFLFDVEDFVFEARQEMMHVAEQG